MKNFTVMNQGLAVNTTKNEKNELECIDQGASTATRSVSARLPLDAVEYLHQVSEREGLDLTRALLLVVRDHQRKSESPAILLAIANLQDSVTHLKSTFGAQISDELTDIRADLISIKSTMLVHSDGIKDVVDYVSAMVPVNESDLNEYPEQNNFYLPEPFQDSQDNDDLRITSMKKPR